MTSLEGWSSTIELRPQQRPVEARSDRHPVAYRLPGAGARSEYIIGPRGCNQPRVPATIAIHRGATGISIGAPAIPVAVEIGTTVPGSRGVPRHAT